MIGLYPENEVTVRMDDSIRHYKGDSILVATGASENMVTFKGWTTPGVIGARRSSDNDESSSCKTRK